MKIDSTAVFKMVVRNGPYTDVGGYPVYFVDDDGDAHCYVCVSSRVVEHIKRLRPKQAEKHDYFWSLIGADINWEDQELRCCMCANKIESAYGE